MSDLISREELLGAFLNLTRSMDKVPEEKIHDLITNAPAINSLQNLETQGEAVGKLVDEGFKQIKWYKKPIVGAELYTTPQQPQSVADAMEEAISIVWDVLDNPELSGHGYCNDLEGRIRALIKRNAVKEGE